MHEFKIKYTVLVKNLNNFKWRNEWHNKNYSGSWILKYFVERSNKNNWKQNRAEKRGIFRNVLATLGASFLGHMLAGKRIVRVGSGNKKGKGILRGSYRNEMDF